MKISYIKKNTNCICYSIYFI